MPMDGLTLGFLTDELNEKLRGGRIDKVQQPERDELLLTIRSLGANYRLLISANAGNARVHLTQQSKLSPMEPPMFCMLLRKHLTGARLLGFRQIGGDRVLRVEMENTDELGVPGPRFLMVEIMGRHSNVMLVDAEGRIVDAIHHVNAEMSRVRQVQPGLAYQAPPSQGKLDPSEATAEQLEEMLSLGGRLSKALMDGLAGLSNQAAQEIAFRLTGNAEAYLEALNRPAMAQKLFALLRQMRTWREPVSFVDEDGTAIDAFAFPQISRDPSAQRKMPSLSEALEACFLERDQRERMKQRSQSLRKTLRTHIERCEKKLALQMETLQADEQLEQLRTQGELLMANIYRIKKGLPSVVLENYNLPDSPPVTIALDVQLTPAQNAQAYFKRYQKLRAAQIMALEQKEKTEQALLFLETQLDDLEKCTAEPEFNEIRQQLIDAGYVRASHTRQAARRLPASKPYRYRSSDGIELLVGKNSLQNDRLTAAADGEELWLHAKDMPGSHVIVKHPGMPPESTLDEALQLAAWYSKGRHSANVPVDYTLRKHVKKPGGAAAGFAVYTHQKTRFVTPEEKTVQRIALLDG